MPKRELATGPIVADALREGKEVYVPYIHQAAVATSGASASVMDMVSLYSQEDFGKLVADSWGIPTPSEASIADRKRCLGDESVDSRDVNGEKKKIRSLDMIVMPGMAFDRRLARLGHGKGYYDLFLARYERAFGGDSGAQSIMPLLSMGILTRQPLIRLR